MKPTFFAIALGMLAVGPANALENQTHLFILSGQSNMAGLDPDTSFTPAVEAEFGAENVKVIKDARGGQPIRRWYKDWKPEKGDDPVATGDLYDRLLQLVQAAVKERDYSTVTFLWMQGEKDAREGHGAVYAESMKGLIAQLSNDLGRDDVNFVIGRLSDFGLTNSKYPDWMKIREAQVAVADASPRGSWVSTDDLNDGVNRKGKEIKNDLHYSVEGYKQFGKRLAEKSIELIKTNGSP